MLAKAALHRVRRLTGGVVTLAVVLAWFLVFRPIALGGPASYIIVAGTSMEPTFETGDLAVTQRRPAYSVGDVVAFSVGDDVVIHRIVGGDAEAGYVVQGDNRDRPDLWRPTPAEILGAVWLSAPAVGRLLALLRQPAYLAAAVAGVTFLLAFTARPLRVRPPGTWLAPTRHGEMRGPVG